MKTFQFKCLGIAALIFLVGCVGHVQADDSFASASTGVAWVRSDKDTVHSGMRVMVVDPVDITPSTKHAPARVQIATIAKVISVKDKRLMILDDFGLGEVDEADIIVLRSRDVFEQIEKRIPASHRTLAKAEFAALYSTPKAWKLFNQAIDEQPDNQWFRARQAMFYDGRGQMIELDGTSLEIKSEGRASAIGKVMRTRFLSINDKSYRLPSIINEDPQNTLARFAMMQNHVDTNALAKLTATADEELDAMRIVAAEIREQVPDHPIASATEIATTISHFNRGGNVDATQFKQALSLGDKASEIDPYNHQLLIALADGYREVNDLGRSGKFALLAVQRFPRKSESMACMLRCADARSSDKEVDAFLNTFPAATLSETLKLIEGIDIPNSDLLPPLRLVDGDGRLDIGYAIDEETQLNVYQILCLKDAHDCLRYLDQYDPTFDIGESNPEFKGMIMACSYSDSFHALQYILSGIKVKAGLEKAFDQAIARESSLCQWVLWNNGSRPSKASLEKLTEALSTDNAGLEKAINDSALETLAKMLPQVMGQAIEMRKLGVEHERESRNVIENLKRIARQQAVFGDLGGHAETTAGIRRTAQGVKQARNIQRLAVGLVADHLEKEYVAIEPLLSADAKETWFKNLDKFLNSQQAWMNEGRSRWPRNIESENK